MSVDESLENIQRLGIIRPGSLYGALTIATTATQIKVGSEDLSGRHAVLIVNDTATDMYFGFNNLVTTANGVPIKARNERYISLSTKHPISLFGIAGSEIEVRVAELK